MQQVPSKLGDIRSMFKAPKDYVMVSCDFSKQEPCVLASASNDSKLIKAFNDGIDIYSVIASMAFNCPYEDCLEHYPDGTTNKEGKKRRTVAKKITLSIMYSKGMKTLSEELGFSMEKTTEIFNSVLGAYPEMAEWMKERVDSAFKLGYTENMFGRKRRLPDLLLPKYEVILPKTLDEEAVKYYKALYTGKLNKARSKEEQSVIVQEAKMKNITIHLNDGKIAKSQREIVNFNIQGCVCGDSFIITKEHGLVHIEDVANQQVTIWDGNKFVNAFCVPSGKKQLVKIKFYDGRLIKCSPEHKFLFVNVHGGQSFKTALELYHMGNIVRMIATSGSNRINVSVKKKELKHPEYAMVTRIESIEITNKYVDMYDIVDSESHQFVVNGVISHNSAASITERAMLNIAHNKRLKELGAYMVMSIHDESLSVVPKAHAYECVELIKQCSLDAGKDLKVPLSCDVAISDNWYGQEYKFNDKHELVLTD